MKLRESSRIEYKYFLPYHLESSFIADLLLFAEADSHSRGGRGYEVASIYYDNFGLKSYHDKLAGLSKRTKLRLRFYPPLTDDGILNIELKHKVFDRIFKEKGSVRVRDFSRLLEQSENSEGLETSDPALSSLSRLVALENFHPFVRIDYCRKAFFDRYDPKIRITVDSRLFCHRFSGNLRARPDIPVLPVGLHIVEVKGPDYMPFWLTTLLGKFNLERMAISKYALAVQNLAVNETAFLR